jgi:hypothetical protein
MKLKCKMKNEKLDKSGLVKKITTRQFDNEAMMKCKMQNENLRIKPLACQAETTLTFVF